MLKKTFIWVFILLSGLGRPFSLEASSTPPFFPFPKASIQKISFYLEGEDSFPLKQDKKLLKKVSGYNWEITFNFEQNLKDLAKQLAQKKVTLLYNTENEIAGKVSLDNHRTIWFKVYPYSESSYIFYEIEEFEIKANSKQSIEISKDKPYIYFTFNHPGDKYITLKLYSENATLLLRARYKETSNDYYHSIDYKRECYKELGPLWELGDIPQIAGEYKYKIELTEGDLPKSITIELKEEKLSLPLIQKGNKIGGILVKNIPYGRAEVRPEFEDYYEYPSFSEEFLRGDKTPQGDSIFWLPPGFWSLKVAPHGKHLPEALKTLFSTAHLIPVQTGKITIIRWPSYLSRVFKDDSSGKLEILKTNLTSKPASVDIALLGEERKTIIPKVDNLKITESGKEAKVLEIKRLNTPLDLVLLLDSSGSMGKSMTQVIKTVSNFIQLLPQNTRLKVIDFDSEPKLIEAQNRKELLQKIKKIKANGATALYDSIIKGIQLLQKKDRPALIVFTDGVDANYNDTGPGSKATKKELLTIVQKNQIPIFTIGFGKKADKDTLLRIATLSQGFFYQADQIESLNEVFATINKNLGSQYRVFFKQPKENIPSDVPVITLVVDNSGSMNMDPQNPSCDYRIEKVRQILKSFVSELPERFLIQLVTFTEDCKLEQVLSKDKAPLIRAISLMRAGGGTNILDSIRIGLLLSQHIPSSEKYLIYLTDAALKVEDENKQEIITFWSQLKDLGIKSLWIGMVNEEESAPFKEAATKSGGKFVVSTNLTKVQRAFEELLTNLINQKIRDNQKIIEVSIAHQEPNGKNTLYVASKLVRTPSQSPINKEKIELEGLSWEIGPSLKTYEPEIAKDITGNDRIGLESELIKRIPLNYTKNNQAISINLKEAYFLNKLRGIKAPHSQRFLAIKMELTNILKPQKVAIYPDGSHHPAAWVSGKAKPIGYKEIIPTYLIPDLSRHLFLRWNDKRSYPLSIATWLAENPLTWPGEEQVAVPAKNPVEGVVIFLVPTEPMSQASLHFYDTNYGHIHIPISGVFSEEANSSLTKLTKYPEGKLSETFSLQLEGFKDLSQINQVKAGENCVFRVIKGNFISQVQAHLSLDPKELFWLKIPTEKGSYFFRVHPVTNQLPLGYYNPTLFTPGSNNPIYFAFRIPKKLAKLKTKGELIVDLKGENITLPLTEQENYSNLTPDLQIEEVGVKILKVGKIDYLSEIGENLIVVELMAQELSKKSHIKLGDLIALKNIKVKEGSAPLSKKLEEKRKQELRRVKKGLTNFATQTSVVSIEKDKWITPLTLSENFLFILDSESIILSGEARRGYLVFSLPEENKIEDLVISSPLQESFSYPLTNLVSLDTSLLTTKKLRVEENLDVAFIENVAKKAQELVTLKKQRNITKAGYLPAPVVDLSGTKGQTLLPPSLDILGHKEFMAINSLENLIDKLNKFRYLPTNNQPWQAKYAPSAVFTQQWGTISDFALIVEDLLTRQGIKTKRLSLELTQQGQKEIKEKSKSSLPTTYVPAIQFEQKGQEKTIVFPFLQDLREIKNLVEYNSIQVNEEHLPECRVYLRLIVENNSSDLHNTTKDIANALAGKEVREDILDILELRAPLLEVSKDFIDIGFARVNKQGKFYYQAIVDGPTGRIRSSELIDTSLYTVKGWEFILELNEESYTRSYTRKVYLPKDTEITDVFFTFALNSPDLPPTILSQLNNLRNKKRKELIGKIGPLSALRWYTHGILTRFLGAQSRQEIELSQKLNIIRGRSLKSRCYLLTLLKPNNNELQTTLDLIYPFDEIHFSPNPKALSAYNIFTGITLAKLEAQALGKKGIGLFEIWEKCPKNTPLLVITSDNQSHFLEQLKQKNYPANLINHFNKLYNKVIFFPASPAFLDNQPRWAWLEMDPQNYQLLPVIDILANGSMVETYIGNLSAQMNEYIAGALVGITTSIWSVSAFSLQLDNYEQIVKEAKEFAKNLGKNFSLNIGNIQVDLNAEASISFGRIGKLALDPQGVGFKNNFLGFANGYQDGVDYYFNQ